MDHFDKFKKQIRKASDLPDYLDWVEVKDGIKTQEDKPRKRRWLFFLILGIGLIGAGLFVSQQNNSPKVDITNNNLATQDFLEKTDSSQSEKIQTNTLDAELGKLVVEKNDNSNSTANSSATSIINHNNNTKSILDKTTNGSFKNSYIAIDKPIKNQVKFSNESKNIYTYLTKESTNISEAINGNGQLKTSRAQLRLEHLSLVNPSHLELPARDLIVIKPKIDSDLDQKAKLIHPWQLSFGIGLNNWDFNFNDLETSTQRKNSEKTLKGFSTSIGLKKQISKNIYVATGLNWNRLFSKFEHEFVNVYQEEREGQIIELTQRPLSSLIDTTIGVGLVNITENRAITHFNKWDIYSIPFIAGWQVQSSKFEFGVGLGIESIFMKNVKGRTIKRSQLLEYTNTNTDYNAAFNFGLIGELSGSYMLTSKFNLGFKVSHNRQLNSWSKDLYLNLSPRITNGQLFISMNL